MEYIQKNGVQRTIRAAGLRPHQGRQSQAHSRRQRRRNEDESESEDEPEPTLPDTDDPQNDASQPPPDIPGLAETYKSRLAEDEARYKALPPETKYVKHNDYIGFRRVVHEAIAGEDGLAPLGSVKLSRYGPSTEGAAVYFRPATVMVADLKKSR